MATIDTFKFDKTGEPYPAGKVIFKQGDEGEYMYVVQEGEVEIKIGDQVVETLGEGGVFGELALIEKEPRAATAVCKTLCKIVKFDQARFKTHILTTPFFAIQIMKVMADRLRQSNKRGA